jgi:hypothetical protein
MSGVLVFAFRPLVFDLSSAKAIKRQIKRQIAKVKRQKCKATGHLPFVISHLKFFSRNGM